MSSIAKKVVKKPELKKVASERTFVVVEDLSGCFACVFDQMDSCRRNQTLENVRAELQEMWEALHELEEEYGEDCTFEKLKWAKSE